MKSFKERLLGRVFRIGRYYAWWVFALALVIAGLGVYYALDIPLRSSAIDLLPRNDPLIEEYKANEEYSSQADFVALLVTLVGDIPDDEMERERRLLEAGEALKLSLEQDPEFVKVVYSEDLSADIPDQYVQLLDLDREELTRIVGSLDLARESIGGEAELPEGTLGDLYAMIAEEAGELLSENAGPLTGSGELDATEIKNQLGTISELNTEILGAIDGVGGLPAVTNAVLDLADIFTPTGQSAQRGPLVFFSRDKTRLLITAQPRLRSQEGVEYSTMVVEKVEAAIERADPEALGVDVRVTGTYPFNSSTNAVINSDMLRTTIVSSIGVFVIFLVAFGSVFYSIIAVIPLLISVVLTMCWAKFAVGGLNLVTTFLPALVLGLGIDYAIHIISRYAEERARGASLNRSLYQSILHKGEASFYAAATTSLVFVGLLLAKSRALFEMGVISSIGVLISFVVTLFLLPALITLAHYLLRGRMKQREGISGYTSRLAGVIRGITGKARAIFVIVLVLTFFIAFQAARTSFVFSDTDLVPRVESQEVMDEILEEFEISPAGIGSYFTFYASTGQELRDVVDRLSENELVEMIESATDIVPVDLTEQQRILKELDIQRYIGQLDTLSQSIEERSAALAEIRNLLAECALLQYAASLNGEVQIALASSQIMSQLRQIQDRLTALDTDLATRSVEGLRSALASLDANLAEVRELPPADELLRNILYAYPDALRSQYLTSNGDFIVKARVSRTIYDAANLDAFERFAASFSDNYFGMPLVVKQLERYMKRDFYLSTLLAAALIGLLLWVSLRGWARALLAGAPLVLGYIWMLGGMRLLSIDFNFLSITISPLLIGIGVDNGIHILHRTMEERAKSPEGAIERGVGSTAIAVIVTSLTTMLVFGSLLVARTPGLRMLGASALLGIGFTLLFCLIFLPAALHVEGGKRV